MMASVMGDGASWNFGVLSTCPRRKANTRWWLTYAACVITGQPSASSFLWLRPSMMALVMSMTKVAIIVTVATTMSIFGTNLLSFFTTELSTGINQMFTGDDTPVAQTIDDNLAWTQLALAAIDTVQVSPGDSEAVDQKNHALLIAGLGTSSAPMAAAAMLLLYKFALALFIGLGPLFILCLIFEQTKSLFQRWLLYGIGTIFSMAVLAFVSSLVLQLSLRVAAALWSANIINTITGQGAEGFSTQALEQGGVGLLLTVLIISVPPMAAMFFQGTLGNFM
ncbi:type IV secretion system protein [Rhodanobacter sp. FW102-FHT14D06]|uniref:Type IV secretion system protein n=2 Tax=unclassified Rhodanobacter TaxID=2621553 RepID=A0AB74UUX1_9GAMM